MLNEGAQVTVASQDIDIVVSEYGVAELKGRTVKDRTEALIRIAHPDHRPWLREEADRLKIVPRLVVPGFDLVRPPRRATAPGVTADTIRLGTFCDLSGPNAAIGLAALRGYSACYEHANRWGGVDGRQIDLIVEDDGFDPARTRLAVEKLVTQEDVFAIVSPLGTITNLAVLDYLLEQRIPVVSPHSGLSIWSSPLKHTYFALQPSYDVEGRLLAQYTLDELQPRRVAVFAVDDQFGQEGAAAFVEELSRAGLEPVTTVKHAAGALSPADWVAELSACQPDLVLIHTYVKPAADLLLAARAASFHPDWLGSYVLSGPDLFQFAGTVATHGLLATSYPAGPRTHRGERLFCKLMAHKYGDETPGTHSRIGYAAAQLVIEGLTRAGPDLTREGFIQALEGLDDWTGGLLPPISYSPTDHRGLTALAMMRALHGRWIREKGLLKLKE
jgi:branched-chain amino acid transport system substrate-binding protein